MEIKKTIQEAIENFGRAFFSEADFQHSLAFEIDKRLKQESIDATVFLEVPFLESREHIDVLIKNKNKIVPIEVKYKTKKKQIESPFGTTIQLADQSAHPDGRFLFLKDISRLERIKELYKSNEVEGFAVFLTNDGAYLRQASGSSRELSLNNGVIYSGRKKLDSVKQWALDLGEIEIKSGYSISWQECKLSDETFYYLIVCV